MSKLIVRASVASALCCLMSLTSADPWNDPYIVPPTYDLWRNRVETDMASGSVAHCYTFDELSAGQQYEVGDRIETSPGAVRLRRYAINGIPPLTDVQFAEVRQSHIAGGSVRELRTVRIVPVVELDPPAHKVTLLFAENSGANGAHANLFANGERREVQGGLAQANSWVMGTNPGNVYVRVLMASDANAGAWHKGGLDLHAMSGSISSFGLGGNPLMLDQVCVFR